MILAYLIYIIYTTTHTTLYTYTPQYTLHRQTDRQRDYTPHSVETSPLVPQQGQGRLPVPAVAC